MKVLKNKNSKGKALLSLFLVLVMLLSIVVPSAALTANKNYKYTTSWLTSLGKYTSTGAAYGYLRKIIVKDGTKQEPVYCIQHEKHLTTDGSGGGTAKTVNVESTAAYKDLSAVAKEGIRLATMFGCHVTTNNYFYAATQIIIWEYQLGKRKSVSSNISTSCGSTYSSFINGNSNIKKCYTAIMQKIKDYKTVLPTLNGKTYSLKGSGKANGITITDSNKVLQYYAMSNDYGLRAERSNGNNTVLLYMGKASTYTGNFTVTGTRTNRYGDKAALCLTGGGQTLWFGYLDDPAASTMKFYISTDYGYGQIIKKNSSNSSDVKGFEFKIYNSSNKLVKTVKSGSDGKTAKFELPTGTYTVKETIGSKYNTVANQTIKIERGKTNYVTFTNSYKDLKFPVYLEKTMNPPTVSPEGCEFVLIGKDKDGTAVNIKATVGSDGKATFENVPVSNSAGYTVYETKGVEGYTCSVKDSDNSIISNITVTENGVQGIGASESNPLKFVNEWNEGYLHIYKLDAKTGARIMSEGFVFKVYDADTNEPITAEWNGVETDTFSSNSEGAVHLKLENGRYYVKEIACPEGCTLNNEASETNTIGEGSTDVIINVEDTVQKGRITVSKEGKAFTTVNETNGKYIPVYSNSRLQGAVFEIYANEDIYELGKLVYEEGETVARITTGEYGDAVYEGPLGSYRIKEVEAPKGHVLNEEEQVVTLKAENQTDEIFFDDISFTNENQKLNLSFVKELEKSEVFGTGNNGEIQNVVFGLYADQELEAEDGSVIPENGLIETVSPDENGNVNFLTSIPEGSYYVKEVSTDEHYILNNTQYGFDYEFSEGTQEKNDVIIAEGENIVNSLISGNINGFKYDELENPVQGAIIGLFAANTEEFTEENALVVTASDEKGEFRFENVPYGSYIVREIEAPNGYLVNTAEWGVNIVEPDEVKNVEIQDQLVKGDLIITKVDDENNFVNGVVFTIYNDFNGNGEIDSEDTVYDYTRTTTDMSKDKKNLLNIFNSVTEKAKEAGAEENSLPTIEEVARYISTGYVEYLSSGSLPEEIDINIDSIKTFSFTNETYKIDDKDMANRIYQYLVWLYYQPQAEIDNTSTYSCVGISKGSYIVKETTTPEDHVADTRLYPFVINENKDVVTISNNDNGTFVNKIVRGSVKITKIEKDTKKVLSGAEFTIYDSNGGAVAKGKSGKDGVAIFNNLKYGDYTVKETKAPEGHKKAEKAYKFSISKDGEVVELLCVNSIIPITPEKNEIVNKNPRTGENVALIVMAIVSVTSMISIAATLLLKKKGLLMASKVVTTKTIYDKCY